MVKTLLLIFLLLFAVSGICELIYIIKMLFYYPGISVHSYVIITLKKGTALKQINYIWQKIKWHGDGFAVGIIAIIDCLEFNEIYNCGKFANDKNIILCTAASLSECNYIQGELSNGNRK